jgi:hypothetical protein
MSTALRGGWWAFIGAALVLLSASAAVAAPVDRELSLVGGTGVPGSTVAVTIQLSGDTANDAASADIDIGFPTDLVEFNLPVSSNCRVAARLAATHQVGGRIVEPGVLTLSLFALNLDIRLLGDGELMTCDFHILPNAELGTAALTAQFVSLFDARGDNLNVRGVDGAITIGEPTPCAVDCNGDGRATVDEIIRGVNIALGNLPLSSCTAADTNGDGTVSISELINGVNRVLSGC